MKRSIFLAVFAILGFIYSANAQESELPKYQRSSLHMVYLTTDEPTLEGEDDFSALLDQAWQEYPFPEKYNEHKIDFTQAYIGRPNGLFVDIINKFANGFDGLSQSEAEELWTSWTSRSSKKAYKEYILNAINHSIETEKVGNQLIRKWFNIQDDGSWNYELIMERAAYNADQADIAEAQVLSRGVQAIFDQGEDLISNTFVTFTKLAFYRNEPYALFSCNLAKFVASFLPEPLYTIGINTADKTYNATKDGYTIKSMTALYQLVWNEEVRATFYDMFEGDKINMEKFNAYTFPVVFVGIEDHENRKNTFWADLGAVGKQKLIDFENNWRETLSLESSNKTVKDMCTRIKGMIIRDIDRQFAKMQKEHQMFAPVAQIISTDPLIADIGMKEGLEGGEKFDLLEQVFNQKTCKIEWKSIGTVTVSKKKGEIWDNRYSLIDEAPADASAIKGTILKNNDKAIPGMLIRQSF